MTALSYSTGTTAGDHTGDDLKDILDAIKAWGATVDALLGSAAGALTPTAITAASTNDYDPGGGFPTAISWLDLNPSTNDIILTGLKAGTDVQTVAVRNIGSTYNISLTNDSSSSIAANRFSGEGDAMIPPRGVVRLTYRSLPSPRWAIG